VKIMGRRPLAAACCLIVFMLAGCATSSSISAKRETLEERVRNYMQAQIDGRWDHVYAFLHSSYRDKVPKESYVNRARDLSYKGFTIEEINVLPSGNEATVKVRIDLLFMGTVFPRASETQNWTKENGEWFMKSSDKINPSKKTTPFTQQKKQK
jgi:hypothetical protein